MNKITNFYILNSDSILKFTDNSGSENADIIINPANFLRLIV